MALNRFAILALIPLVALASTTVRAVSVRTWAISTAEEFARGEFEGTALDPGGRVGLAQRVEMLWGPEDGIVWDVEPDGAGGAFVALSSPGRVLRVTPGAPPQDWYLAQDESLVAAIAADGEGGVYIGVSPGGALLHARAAGEARKLTDTGARFVWALDVAEDGGVWIGTGLPGRLLRYGADGALVPWFESEDDPLRCVRSVPGGGVILGTGGEGRVVRVDRHMRPFVLLDADETEIVAIEPAADGSIHALAAHGAKQITPAGGGAAQAATESVRVVAEPPPASEETDAERARRAEESRPPRASAKQRFRAMPGGVLYRIRPEGDAHRIWETAGEVPFDLVRTEGDRLLVGTGDGGRIYALDDRGDASVMLELPSDQVSSLARAADGRVLVGGTTNARVGWIGPALRSSGSYITPPLDAGSVADWGRLVWDADVPSGAELGVWVRSGNTGNPDATWSEWIAIGRSGREAGPTGLRPTRWFQARVDLRPSRKGATPLLRRMELFYVPHNRRPSIDELTVLPPGVVWTSAPTQGTRPVGPLVADDPIARKTVDTLRPALAVRPVRKSYELGARTVSWKVSDPDGDRLSYRLEIRHDAESAWIPLAVDLDADFHSWDARGLPDGLYRVRLTANDSRDNARGREFEDEKFSAAFWIDNTRPSVSERGVRRAPAGYEVEFVARDPGGNVAAVEIAVDAGEWQPLEPLDGVADSDEERYQVLIEPLAQEPVSRRTLKVRVTDSAGNLGGDAWALER